VDRATDICVVHGTGLLEIACGVEERKAVSGDLATVNVTTAS
jgi:hypothetical protein